DGNTSTITGIPYPVYDVYVYGSSDTGNDIGRGWNTNINGTLFSSAPGEWEGPVSEATFFDNTNYVDGSTGANNPTYFFAESLSGDLTISGLRQTIDGLDTRGAVSGFQIVESTGNPQVLTLEINTDTGAGSIKNTTGNPIDLDFYEITSDPSASLNFAGWNSIQDNGQNGYPQGDGSGNGWEELGNPGELGDDLLAEFYLDGNSTLADGASIALGTIYKTATGVQDDIGFRYTDLNTFTRDGLIEFVTGGMTLFDANVDMTVNNDDIPDFVTALLNLADWQALHPGLDPLLYLDGDGNGFVNNDDIPSFVAALLDPPFLTGSSSAVPEPSSLALLLATCGGVALSVRRKKVAHRRRKKGAIKMDLTRCLPAIIAVVFVSTTALADVTNDRVYQMGEDGLEGAVPGAIVGSGHSFPDTGTLDSGETGDPTGSFIDLDLAGDPRYVDVSTLGSGRTGIGIQFDGTDDNLNGVPLNRPDELSSLPCCGSYPFDYTGILGHGSQGWVYPAASALGSSGSPTTFQSILADTELTGGPAINDVGQWTQINSNHADGVSNGVAPMPATVDVAAGDTWYHFMHHNNPTGGDNFQSVLYIDGIAVSANLDPIPTTGVANQLGQVVIGAAEVNGDGLTPAYGNHFTGAVDDVNMYVFGDNGTNYGTFDLFADNEWIATEITNTVTGGMLVAGDTDKDGDVDDVDVDLFVAGWRSEKILPGAHGDVMAGDWLTWNDGDFDHNGTTNFTDWFMLRANHPNGPSLNLGALLAAAAVPEPSSIVLVLGGMAGLGLVARSRRAA
ncbi:MAG: PEP-CTERM sorting domain-containing protein, partial [Aeoliella sp.]